MLIFVKRVEYVSTFLVLYVYVTLSQNYLLKRLFFLYSIAFTLSNFHWLWVKVTRLCLTLCNPMDCTPYAPLSMGILKARIQEGTAVPSSIGSSWPRDRTQVSWIAGRLFTNWVTREAHWLSLTISGPISGYSILFQWFVYSFLPIQHCIDYCCCSVTQSCLILCDPMDCRTPGFAVLHCLPVCSNSCPLSQWCHSTISSSVLPFSSCFSLCLQSFPTSGSFPMSHLFTSGGQSIGASASASVLPINI